jgi:hypothetical protein
LPENAKSPPLRCIGGLLDLISGLLLIFRKSPPTRSPRDDDGYGDGGGGMSWDAFSPLQ